MSHVILAHLSQKNNTPAIATATIRSALDGSGFTGHVTAAAQGRVSGPFTPNGIANPGLLQLQLGIG